MEKTDLLQQELQTEIDQVLAGMEALVSASSGGKKEKLLPLFEKHVRRNQAVLPAYAGFLKKSGFTDSSRIHDYADIPYFHVSAFKGHELCLVPKDQVTRVLQSSGTSTSQPSKIFLDKPTLFRQTKALAGSLISVIGSKRRPFLVLDSSARMQSQDSITARDAVIRGLAPFASKMVYAMKAASATATPELDVEAIRAFFKEVGDQEYLIAGMTFSAWMDVILPLKKLGVSFSSRQ